jgi:hypothetical protein
MNYNDRKLNKCKIAGPEIDKSSDPKAEGNKDVSNPVGFRI